ncbi:hypothetical protein EDEG_02334 [Edhazardia aedis USNM 41457]|uniref:Uncharacterized protein n=1 Tax=Edhazardia aedis (strain USNM 41457) TaxID=1003232 RepID=J9D6A1_EDHAE|nr:hypothetical protein EDEG_02334 [Edhazardia aedis USNM 41457]|eukprot:EJW03326.1 hypothetical protein EDEG_02334 [Edhazardia aedis USNM 41457]
MVICENQDTPRNISFLKDIYESGINKEKEKNILDGMLEKEHNMKRKIVSNCMPIKKKSESYVHGNNQTKCDKLKKIGKLCNEKMIQFDKLEDSKISEFERVLDKNIKKLNDDKLKKFEEAECANITESKGIEIVEISRNDFNLELESTIVNKNTRKFRKHNDNQNIEESENRNVHTNFAKLIEAYNKNEVNKSPNTENTHKNVCKALKQPLIIEVSSNTNSEEIIINKEQKNKIRVSKQSSNTAYDSKNHASILRNPSQNTDMQDNENTYLITDKKTKTTEFTDISNNIDKEKINCSTNVKKYLNREVFKIIRKGVNSADTIKQIVEIIQKSINIDEVKQDLNEKIEKDIIFVSDENVFAKKNLGMIDETSLYVNVKAFVESINHKIDEESGKCEPDKKLEKRVNTFISSINIREHTSCNLPDISIDRGINLNSISRCDQNIVETDVKAEDNVGKTKFLNKKTIDSLSEKKTKSDSLNSKDDIKTIYNSKKACEELSNDTISYHEDSISEKTEKDQNFKKIFRNFEKNSQNKVIDYNTKNAKILQSQSSKLAVFVDEKELEDDTKNKNISNLDVLNENTPGNIRILTEKYNTHKIDSEINIKHETESNINSEKNKLSEFLSIINISEKEPNFKKKI